MESALLYAEWCETPKVEAVAGELVGTTGSEVLKDVSRTRGVTSRQVESRPLRVQPSKAPPVQ